VGIGLIMARSMAANIYPTHRTQERSHLHRSTADGKRGSVGGFCVSLVTFVSFVWLSDCSWQGREHFDLNITSTTICISPGAIELNSLHIHRSTLF